MQEVPSVSGPASLKAGPTTKVGGHPNPAELDDPRIRAGTDDDHLGLVLIGQTVELLVIDTLVVFPHAIGNDRIELA